MPVRPPAASSALSSPAAAACLHARGWHARKVGVAREICASRRRSQRAAWVSAWFSGRGLPRWRAPGCCGRAPCVRRATLPASMLPGTPGGVIASGEVAMRPRPSEQSQPRPQRRLLSCPKTVLCGAEEEGEGKTMVRQMVRHMRGLQQEAGGALIPRTAQRRRQGNPGLDRPGTRVLSPTQRTCAPTCSG